jgi:general secretion pathway protein C
MAFPPELTRNRALFALAASLLMGMVAGTGVNVFAGTKLTLPEDAEVPEYTDAAPQPDAASEEPAAVGPSGEGDSSPEAPVAFSGDKRVYVDAIVRRNIFDSAARPAEATADAGSFDCKESGSHLLATVVADLPEYSSALIGGGGKSSRALGYKVGDSVGSEGRIITIEQKKVCLDGGACICMGDNNKRAESTEVAATGEGDEGGVTKLSDTKFLVDRSFLEKQLGNVEQLATQIRASPKTEDGQIVGFRLSAIRRGSVFDKLGIKNGDIVHTVNGQSLTSMETAMGAYGSLQNERGFNFEVTRRNQKMTIEYEVR